MFGLGRTLDCGTGSFGWETDVRLSEYDVGSESRPVLLVG